MHVCKEAQFSCDRQGWHGQKSKQRNIPPLVKKTPKKKNKNYSIHLNPRTLMKFISLPPKRENSEKIQVISSNQTQ